MSRRLVAFIMAVVMGLVPLLSLAESAFPQLSAWEQAGTPLAMTFTVNVTERMPFNDKRMEQLMGLLKHLSLRVEYQPLQDETWSRVMVQVDDAPVVTLAQRTTPADCAVQLSFQPKVTYYQEGADAENLCLTLLGGTPVESDDFDLTLWQMLQEAEAWLPKAVEALAPWTKSKAVKTSIENYGTARTKLTITIPKDEAEAASVALHGVAAQGLLGQWLSKAAFEGKQTILAYFDEEGQLLKVTWEGNCILGEEAKEGELEWRLARSETKVRDDFTFKLVPVKGTDRDKWTFDRICSQKNGKTTCELEASTEVKRGKSVVKTQADIEYTLAPSDNGQNLTGTGVVKQTEGEETLWKVTLSPDVVMSLPEDTPSLQGSLGIKVHNGKRLVQEAELGIKLEPCDYFEWELREESVQVDSLNEKQMETIRTSIADSLLPALIRPLVLLPAEDTLFLSDGLDEGVWEQIVTIASSYMN